MANLRADLKAITKEMRVGNGLALFGAIGFTAAAALWWFVWWVTP